MEEEWKDIGLFNGIDYKGNYQVSNMGQVRSIDRKINSSFNKQRITKGKILKQPFNAYGYKVLNLSINSKITTAKVHRLVAYAFIDNPKNKKTVNHISGIKSDNRVCNLEWATYSENVTHAYKLKLINPKNKGTHLRIKVDMYTLDNVFIKTYNSITNARKDNGIKSKSCITKCCKDNTQSCFGYKWKYHITDKEDS